MSSRKVTYARLHQMMYVPGVGQLDTTFPSSSKTLDKLEMTTEDGGLGVTFLYKGIKVDLLVPYANIVGMTRAPAEEPKKPASVSKVEKVA